MSGKYKPRGRTKEQSNDLRKNSWTHEMRAAAAERNRQRSIQRATAFIMPMSKACNLCGIVKPLDSYATTNNRFALDGRLNNCKPCEVKRVSEWNVANPEKAAKWREVNQKRLNKEHYEANREAILELKRQQRLDNPERFKNQEKQYAERNPGKLRAKYARRRAAELKATPPWLSFIQLAQIDEFYELAAAKKMQSGIEIHVDHIVPLQGKDIRGLHVPWNLQLLTERENCSKNNKLMEGSV